MIIDTVDPREHVEAASRILGDAWQPPCLRYTPAHLHWHFHFPGPPEPIGVLARDKNEPVGFFAAVPRRVRVGTRVSDVFLLSFLAVRPAWRGLSLSTELYRAVLGALSAASRPVVLFARAGELAANHVKNFAAAEFQCRELGLSKTYGYVPRSADREGAVSVVEATDEEFLAVVERCRAERVLWSHPSREQLAHYRSDERGRKLLVARLENGECLGAAIVARSETLSADGPQDFAMLDSVFLAAPDAEALSAIGAYASALWRSECQTPVVTAPSMAAVGAALLRKAGFREMPSAFQGYFFYNDSGNELSGCDSTNLEVV